MWDGTDDIGAKEELGWISIHPSRVGWDVITASANENHPPISIHPSRVGWDDEWELDEIAWE